MKGTLFLSVLATTLAVSSRGDEPMPEDKSHYTLFNPTPSESMRVWRTDRAGVTPYTVDAGHFEVDVTLVTYGYDEFEPRSVGLMFLPKFSTDAWAYGATTIKLGLLNRLD